MTSDFERAAREHAASRGAKGTRALYSADLTTWLAFCDAQSFDPARPTRAAVIAYRDKLQASVADATVRRTLAALSSMYDNALDDEGKPVASWNPFRKLPRPAAVTHGLTESVTDEAAQAVIAEAEKDSSYFGVRDAALIRLLYDTGLRVSSVVALKRTSLFRRGTQLLLRVVVKGGKQKEVEIPDEAAEALDRWLYIASDSEFVFPARGGKGAFATKAVNKRLDVYAKAAGVGHVHPHQFRAAYITSALDAGVPLNEVRASVHHEDPKTTLRYDRKERGAGVTAAVSAFREEKKNATKAPDEET
jgi:site-specific recombinase XerD